MRFGVDRFYIHWHYLSILIFFKLYIDFLKRLRQLENSFGLDFDLNRELKKYDNGNRTKLTYPSRIDPSNSESPLKEVVYTPDPLDRIDIITSGTNKIADYNYEGKAKVTTKKLFNDKVVMTAVHDDGRRPTTLTYISNNNTLFNRDMGWNLMDMKLTETGQGSGKGYTYDTGWRLRREDNRKGDLLAESLEFVIDGVENLKYIQPVQLISSSTDYHVLRCQHNERHQVTSVDYKQIVNNEYTTIHVEPTYDTNGNLKSFIHQYTYNYRNQLIEVVTGTGVVVKYKYDALGRRIEKSVTDPEGETITRYVHDGWRVIEERDNNDNVKTRYTYGNGIDERVELEYDVNNTLTPFIPMQDSIGNVIGIADETGKVVEKYTYSTYGAPVFGYDMKKPKVESVTTIDGLILINFSEPVDQDKAKDAVSIKMGGLDISGDFSFSEDGRTAIFTPSGTLPHGDITVEISTDLEDKAGNPLENIVSQNFNYQGADIVAYDSSPPEVERIDKISNDFIVKYSETINTETIERSIEIRKADGTISGTIKSINPSTYKFTPEEMLEIGKEYEMRVNAVRDLSGKEINEFFHKFVVMNEDMLVYEKADPNQHSTSHIRNNYLFHGRTYEPEVGLYFYRHRYYLPRLGRFLQTDPMGYEDSLNLYQAFNQNPVNFVDPMGEDYYRSEYYKRLTSNAKPITWEEIDTALTGISEATRWGVQRVVNLGLGLIQSAGHLINSIFIPGYGNRDHYFYYLDLEDPSGHSVSVDSRPSYQKVAGYSGGDMAKLPEHLYEAGKSGIKMLDPTLSSSERKQHAKRFVEGLTDAGVLVWCGYKYYKNYKAISPITEIAATESNIQMMEIPDDAFVHVTTKQGAQDILKSGLDPNYSGYVTKWKYVKDVNNPKEFNTKIYSQSLWKKKTGKFDEGAYILEINPIENPKYFGPFTNRVNGFPQWLFQGKIIDPNRIGLIKIIPGGN